LFSGKVASGKFAKSSSEITVMNEDPDEDIDGDGVDGVVEST
jgi:hypothetical protein